MKRSRSTEDQIIGILLEQEAGARAADLCRKYGMSEATLYNWKAKFGGMAPRAGPLLLSRHTAYQPPRL
jgi:putative transposase